MSAAKVETEQALPVVHTKVTSDTGEIHLPASVSNPPAEGVHTVLTGSSENEASVDKSTTDQDAIEPTPAQSTTARKNDASQVHTGSPRDVSPGDATARNASLDGSTRKGQSGFATSAAQNLDDGKDFHRRPSNTHNPIIHLRDKFFPAGAGPAADYTAPYEYDKNFHATPSATHNPIIAVRDALFPAGKGPSGAANAVEYETDPNFHARQSKTHNPIIAARDHLFPAGRGSEGTAKFENDPNFHAKPSQSHNPIIAIRDSLFPAGSADAATTSTEVPHKFPGTASGSSTPRKGSVVIEPHTGLPMDLSRGTGKGGIDGNRNNHGYIGGGHEPETRDSISQGRRRSIVIEPHTGLPMDLSQGTGKGGIDGNTHNPGYTGGGITPPDQEQVAEHRRQSTVLEPHTGLPMNLELGSGKGGIDGNALNPGYTGGGKMPEELDKLDQQRRKSTVLEPHTQLPMNTQLGLGQGGTDGDVNNRGLIQTS